MKKHIILLIIFFVCAISHIQTSEQLSSPNNSRHASNYQMYAPLSCNDFSDCQTHTLPPSYQDFINEVRRKVCELMLNPQDIAIMKTQDCEINNDKLFALICNNPFLCFDQNVRENQSFVALCVNTGHFELLIELIKIFPHLINSQTTTSKRLPTGEKYEIPIYLALKRKKGYTSSSIRQKSMITRLLHLINDQQANMQSDNSEQCHMLATQSSGLNPLFDSASHNPNHNLDISKRFQHNPYRPNTPPHN